MPEKIKAPIYELCEQAFNQWEQSLKAGLKFQEDAARLCLEPLAPFPTTAEARKRLMQLASEGTAATQRNVEEGIRLMEQASKTSLDAYKQLMQVFPMEPAEGVQSKVKTMWDNYLGAMRTNVQTLAQANARLMESWVQALPKDMPGFAPKAKAA